MANRARTGKGITSIFLAIYLVILVSIITSVLYTAVNVATALARQQINSFQNYYYIERAIKYAVWHYNRDTAPHSWPADDAELNYPLTDHTHTTIATSGTGPFTILATRKDKTVRAIYDASRGIFTYWGPP